MRCPATAPKKKTPSQFRSTTRFFTPRVCFLCFTATKWLDFVDYEEKIEFFWFFDIFHEHVPQMSKIMESTKFIKIHQKSSKIIKNHQKITWFRYNSPVGWPTATEMMLWMGISMKLNMLKEFLKKDQNSDF